MSLYKARKVYLQKNKLPDIQNEENGGIVQNIVSIFVVTYGKSVLVKFSDIRFKLGTEN